MLEKISIGQFEVLLSKKEGEALELKEAKNTFSASALSDYSAAIANERGGKLILGVSNDSKPVGTSVFQGTENKLSHKIFQDTGLKTLVTPYEVQGKRTLVISIPARPVGRPIQSRGKYHYPMRLGESISEMDTDTLSRIFAEISPDHSAEIVSGSSIKDIDDSLVEKFKILWAKKTGRDEYLRKSIKETLSSLNLLEKGELTLAALILFGNTQSLSKFCPDAEIVFEWRADENQTNFDFRESWRKGFIGVYDEIWKTLDARNTRHTFQEGLVQREVKAFDEKPFREALLNSVAHRDYKMSGHSIFIKANPEHYTMESPGGLIGGVNLRNIFEKTAWRNRLLAETLEKAGLVERSGQGIDDIFEITIRNGKGAPIIEEPFSNSFKITIPAKIEDSKFIKYLESISQEKNINLRLDEIIELEEIRKSGPTKKIKSKEKFITYGLIEKVGRGKGSAYILSHKYYQTAHSTGVYTRLAGIPRNVKKQMILQHIKQNGRGIRTEFIDALPDLSSQDISNLLQELRNEKKIIFQGARRSGYWVLQAGN